ncbi:preprotein translocase subunit SecA [Conexibacter sp. DBS9H8]|uniref:preprotein translocase subunit SecA n=1 Tax=Conexibacter sp. DBS9H8 TaxID=2937801 RepID=UPI00273A72DA|nr:preprotein translocase subunit SecA [Conexibacter sp. DBS9H8]
MSLLDRALRIGEGKKFKSYEQRVARIGAYEPEMEASSDGELRGIADELRERARNGESLDALLPETFALVREASRRTMGMRHFDVQLIGGMVLHDGSIAEMRTGEGKTLTATLAVVLNTLGGRGVHVVTVNDYLARRDALWMKPIYDFLGVSVGILQNMQPYEEKQAAYAADVTYGTNSEYGFDYLRDNMAVSLEQKVQHGGRARPAGGGSAAHAYAIVDEVDNILIDEARTPLIISGAPEQAADIYVQFAKLAKVMEPGKTPEGLLPPERKAFVADFDYEFDEKYKTVSVTERGVAKAERFLRIEHLYRAENGHLVNHLQQALKAESLFKNGEDYLVIDGEVKIVDEHTGRILEGRRWSEGLHQAIEAKEGVRIQEENQTLASITYQNFFRMYDKLAGMTGTAITEATEFMKIYDLPVVQIPTNRPMQRDDRNDQVYKTKEGKWTAVLREIEARHAKGQPVLVGTIAVDVSELLSARLRARGIPHTVLNAKPEYVERESEIVAEAGQPGAVTIATNMAGRGVDIKLGGNPEHMATLAARSLGLSDGTPEFEAQVAELLSRFEAQVEDDRARVEAAGGLCIIGTERHESRRIDNQLRGRAGRQGDPGESRFFLSAEDDLVRLFAGDRIYRILDRLGTTDAEGNEEPIEAGMLSKQIEKAQKKVEENAFLARKHTLEYDDVLNEQRRVIYTYRDEILEGRDMREAARDEIANHVRRLVAEYAGGDFVDDWDIPGLLTQVQEIFVPSDALMESLVPGQLDRDDLEQRLVGEAMSQYEAREQVFGEEWMRVVERFLLLQTIDQRWKEHLHDMDYLREGIHLRSLGGMSVTDPLVNYKNEAFSLFGDLMNLIWSDFSRLIFHVAPADPVQDPATAPAPAPRRAPSSSSATGRARVSYSGGAGLRGSQAIAAAAAASGPVSDAELGPEPAGNGGAPVAVQQRTVDAEHELGRNDPCWCGSGKKFKKCHGA